MRKNIMLTLFAICVILCFVGCKNGNLSMKQKQEEDADSLLTMENQGLVDNTISGDEEDELKVEEPEVYEYNESGKIIIVMYHKFATEEKDEWTRSYENFYKDLEYLYDHGYRSISLNDYLTNHIEVPVRYNTYCFYI